MDGWLLIEALPKGVISIGESGVDSAVAWWPSELSMGEGGTQPGRGGQERKR
jgi:hypothetical protein